MNLRRFFRVLRFTPLLFVAGCALSASTCVASDPIPRSSPIVVLPSQVRIGGYPVQVGTLPLGESQPYLFSRPGRAGGAIPVPNLHDVAEAALSPSGKRIAYVSREGVVVADRSGRTIGVQKDAVGFRWSPDGESLALLMGKSASRPDAAAGLGVWDLRTKETRYHRRGVDQISWGARDTVYYGLDREYWAIQPGSRGPSRTGHHGIDVSPDGLYSVDRVPGYWCGYQIVHDRTGVDVSPAAFASLGSFTIKHTAEPFWIAGAGHLLCLSVCGIWPSADSTRWECRTAVVDVLSSELLAWWNGMALGPSADGKSVWVTDGYDVTPWRFKVPPRRVESTGDEIRVKASTREWSSRGGERLVGEKLYALRAGDSVPAPSRKSPALTLVEIAGPNRAVFRIDRGYRVTTPFNHQPRPGLYEVGSKGIVVAEDSFDAGYIIQLSLLP
jgi:hypothetical protein